MIHNLYFPWRFWAEYEDGFETYIQGDSEDECIETIAKFKELHGECIYYTGVNDEVYVDGRCII